MNTNIRLALVSLFVVAAPAANAADFEDLATVLSVTERLDRYNQPRQECNADPVAAAPTAAPADRGIGGSVIGGVSGAILGAQVGKGNGKVAAAAVGAVTGALVGDHIQNDGTSTNNQAAQPVQPAQHCYSYNDNYGNPHQECTPTAAPASADRGIGGSVIGGVSGAILGAQVGKGNGKVAAAAIGAVTGALVGDRIQNNGTNSQAAQPVQRCRYVDNFVTRVSGYTVTYQYRGNTYTDNVGFNPGPTMRVRVNLTPRG